jgi:hypothetical protein
MLLVAVACGSFASKPKFSGGEGAAVATTKATVTGSLASLVGRQSDLEGWVVLLLERDAQIGRSAVVDAKGQFSLPSARLDRPQMLALLSPQYVLRSILTLPESGTTQFREFFSTSAAALPRVIQRGPILSFASLEGITPEGDLIDSGPLANAPAGALGKNGYGLADAGPVAGNGLPRVFSPDVDGNGTIDLFEGGGAGGGATFAEGFEYVTAQLDVRYAADGARALELLLLARARGAAEHGGIVVHGPTALFAGATVAPGGEAWDGTLRDDGANDDGTAGDGIYARRVRLAGHDLPGAFQALLFGLDMSPGNADGAAEEWIAALTFPPFTLATLRAPEVSVTDATAKRLDAPFPGITTYDWVAAVYDGSGALAYVSPVSSGDVDTVALPAAVLAGNVGGGVEMIASTQAGVGGIARIVVHGPRTPIVAAPTPTPEATATPEPTSTP